MRIILFIFCFFAVIVNINSQNLEPKTGLKAGLNISNVFISEIDAQNPRFGYHAGIFSLIPVSEKIGFQLELLYSTKGSTFTTNSDFLFGIVPGREVELKLDYLDFPVLMVFSINEFLKIEAGAVGSILINSSVNAIGSSQLDGEVTLDHFRRFDIGLVAGPRLNVDPLILGVRYNYGLFGLGEDQIPQEFMEDVNHSVFQMYVSLSF